MHSIIHEPEAYERILENLKTKIRKRLPLRLSSFLFSLTFSPSHFCLLPLLWFPFLMQLFHSFLFFLPAPFPFITSISFLLVLFSRHSCQFPFPSLFISSSSFSSSFSSSLPVSFLLLSAELNRAGDCGGVFAFGQELHRDLREEPPGFLELGWRAVEQEAGHFRGEFSAHNSLSQLGELRSWLRASCMIRLARKCLSVASAHLWACSRSNFPGIGVGFVRKHMQRSALCFMEIFLPKREFL